LTHFSADPIIQSSIKTPNILRDLLAAYKKIGDALPTLETRFDNDDSDERQQILAYVYDDVLEYHADIYQLLTQQGAIPINFMDAMYLM
jgi:hypothetical protein